MPLPCRYVNTIMKSKLDPVNKGLVLEETKTKPIGFIKMLIRKIEVKNDFMESLIETNKEFVFKHSNLTKS